MADETRPFFSIVITTFNRRDIVSRCIESCLDQTYDDYEVVVVDDASTDGTRESLSARWGDRISVVSHEFNRGISPARHTGVSAARGEWIVVMDSDWVLLPAALDRFRRIIDDAPEEIRAIRSRMLWDDVRASPAFMPAGPVGYIERIRWVEEEGGDDATCCMHRSVFETTPYMHDRRGTVEELYELDLARGTTSLYVSDILAKQYSDAPNSYLRTVDRRVLLPQLLNDAPDLLWMAETVLERHGAALREHGPRLFDKMMYLASSKAFLVGDRRKALRYALRALRRSPAEPIAWFTLALGLLGPRFLAYGTLAYRRILGSRGRAAPPLHDSDLATP